MAFVNKSKLINSVDALLAASNLPTLSDLAANAQSVSQQRLSEAQSLTNLALAESDAADEEFKQKMDAATLVLKDKKKAVEVKLNNAAALNQEAQQLSDAAKYIKP